MRYVFAALVLAATASLHADSISFDLFGAWIDPIARGNIRPVDATLTFAPRLRPGAGMTLFLGQRVALSVSDSHRRMPVTLHEFGSAASHSQFRLDSRDAVLKASVGDWILRPYAGVGVTLPGIHRLQPLSSGEVTVIRASSPDHAALIVNGGVVYPFTQHVHTFADVKYEPFRSTAEVRRVQAPGDDLQSDFHLLTIASGVSIRF